MPSKPQQMSISAESAFCIDWHGGPQWTVKSITFHLVESNALTGVHYVSLRYQRNDNFRYFNYEYWKSIFTCVYSISYQTYSWFWFCLVFSTSQRFVNSLYWISKISLGDSIDWPSASDIILDNMGNIDLYSGKHNRNCPYVRLKYLLYLT